MNNEIHIVCATDSNYIPYCGVLLTSIFENNKEENVYVHILGTALSVENKMALYRVKDRYNQEVIFYDIDDVIAHNESLKQWNEVNKTASWSIATFYRLFVADVLPTTLNQVLYLDIDTIVCGSLKELWVEGLGGRAIGWVIDGKPEPNMKRLHLTNYFNAGVLLINLDFWRKHQIQKRCMDYLALHWQDLQYVDQDVINPILQEYDYKELHPKYNVISYFFLCDSDYKRFIPQKYWEVGREAMSNPIIIHYISSVKPWHKDCDHPLKNEWLKYLRQTEWRDLKMTNKRTVLLRLRLLIKECVKDIARLIPSIREAHPNPKNRWYSGL